MYKLIAIAFSFLLSAASCKKTNEHVTTTGVSYIADVNLAAAQQTIRGFGGATVFRPDLTDADVNTLFGNANDNQLGLTILRIRVSPQGPGDWGTELSNAKRAIALGASVIATPWSPPASMKTNNNTTGGRLSPSSYSAYAAYLERFADYMSTNGASLYGLSIQNEPDIQVNYESCDWSAQEMTDFIRDNTFNIATTKLLAAESFNFNQSYTDVILNDASAAAKVAIIGGHIYGGGLAKYDNALNKGKEVWMTEHLDTMTTWPSVMATAKEIHDCMAIANYSAYLWWYVKRFYGPINENGQITKRGYVMAQFSKYIRPGYQRVDVSNPAPNVYLSAYKENGKTVIVAVNTGSLTTIKFNIRGGTTPGSFTPYVTSRLENLSREATLDVSDGSFTYTLPESCVTTFVSN
ncbi:MAG TPA: glucuronoxylanase [Chitinophagaceae bacterium]|nr:glucuronoxylanase [Chitinophagaceae bacterium]